MLKAYWETSHPGLELATELSKTRPVEKQVSEHYEKGLPLLVSML